MTTSQKTPVTPCLAAQAVDAGYNGQPVVTGLNLEVHPGQVAVLLGPNGAGKTTSLLTLAGELEPIAGEVLVDGSPSAGGLHRRARQGMAFVTEERSVFMEMTVAENLHVGRCSARAATAVFPELERLMDRRAGLLSGGEQQMLTLARALAREPRMLLIDELSLGLAPQAATRLLGAIRAAADAGVAVLLVEQHVQQAMKIADYVYVLERGQLVLEGRKADVAGRLAEIEASYLDPSRTPAAGPA
jgi:branched-chain amino acid transport system ATP-binding protein